MKFMRVAIIAEKKHKSKIYWDRATRVWPRYRLSCIRLIFTKKFCYYYQEFVLYTFTKGYRIERVYEFY